ARLFGEEISTGARLEICDRPRDIVDLFELDAERPSDGGIDAPFKIAEVIADGPDDEIVKAVDLRLDEQALSERSRGDAHGIEPLDLFERFFGVLGIEPRLFGDGRYDLVFGDAVEAEITRFVEVADDEACKTKLVLGVISHLELPAEMFDQAR